MTITNIHLTMEKYLDDSIWLVKEYRKCITLFLSTFTPYLNYKINMILDITNEVKTNLYKKLTNYHMKFTKYDKYPNIISDKCREFNIIYESIENIYKQLSYY